MSLRRRKTYALFAFALVLLFTLPAQGQQNGHYLQSATGLMNGSLPPPGYYLGVVQFEYFVDSIKGPNGGSIPAHLTISAPIALMSAVTKTKFLGADYGFSFLVPIMNQRFTTNILPSRTFGAYGVSDIFFTPVQLGWHKSKADILFAYTLAASTGDYSSDQVFNTGLGMWSNMFQLGATYYPDKFKKWNASVLSTWEIDTTKAGTSIKPGSSGQDGRPVSVCIAFVSGYPALRRGQRLHIVGASASSVNASASVSEPLRRAKSPVRASFLLRTNLVADAHARPC